MSSSLAKSISASRTTAKGSGVVPHGPSSVPGASSKTNSTTVQQQIKEQTGPSSVFQSKKARQTRQLVAEAAAYAVDGTAVGSHGSEVTSDGTGLDDYEGGKIGRQAKQVSLAADKQSVKDLDRWAERETGFIDDEKDDF